MDFSEIVEQFLQSTLRTPYTKNQYRFALGKHFEFLKGLKGQEYELSSVTSKDVQAWFDDLKSQEYSIWTVTRRVKDIKAFWKWMGDSKRISSSPAAHLVVTQFNPNPMRTMMISDEDLDLLIEVAKEKSKREYAIVRLLADTGCRRKSVANLRLSQVDLKSGYAIFLGKDDHFYPCPLTNRVVDALQDYLAVRPRKLRHDYIFVSERRPYGPLSLAGVSSLWRRLTTGVKFEGKHNMHSLRHYFTSRLARQGINIAYIQEALGHKNIETTRLYIKVCQDTLKDVMEDISIP